MIHLHKKNVRIVRMTTVQKSFTFSFFFLETGTSDVTSRSLVENNFPHRRPLQH